MKPAIRITKNSGEEFYTVHFNDVAVAYCTVHSTVGAREDRIFISKFKGWIARPHSGIIRRLLIDTINETSRATIDKLAEAMANEFKKQTELLEDDLMDLGIVDVKSEEI